MLRLSIQGSNLVSFVRLQSPRVASLVVVVVMTVNPVVVVVVVVMTVNPVVVVVVVVPAAVALPPKSGCLAVVKVMVRQSVVRVRILVTACPTLLYCK